MNILTPADLLVKIERLSTEGGHRRKVLQLQGVDRSLLQQVVAGEDELRKIGDRQFEALVAALLKADGYNSVDLIPRLNSTGPDVIARCAGLSGQELQFIVECKRWNDAVGIDVLRDVVYRLDHETPATGALIVTTSRFTSVAKEAAKRHKWRLTLKDGQDIIEWARRSATHEIYEEIQHENFRHSEYGFQITCYLLNDANSPALRSARDACQRCGADVVCATLSNDDVGLEYRAYFHICTGCLSHTLKNKYDENHPHIPVPDTECPLCRLQSSP